MFCFVSDHAFARAQRVPGLNPPWLVCPAPLLFVLFILACRRLRSSLISTITSGSCSRSVAACRPCCSFVEWATRDLLLGGCVVLFPVLCFLGFSLSPHFCVCTSAATHLQLMPVTRGLTRCLYFARDSLPTLLLRLLIGARLTRACRLFASLLFVVSLFAVHGAYSRVGFFPSPPPRDVRRTLHLSCGILPDFCVGWFLLSFVRTPRDGEILLLHFF